MRCPVCQGRGEVEAGITYGKNLGQPDSSGVERREAIEVRINPAAQDAEGHIWFLDFNRLVPLWSTAICVRCRGSGELEEYNAGSARKSVGAQGTQVVISSHNQEAYISGVSRLRRRT